jgi:NTE family protein
MQTLRSWLSEGKFTLALSSSFFGFYAHCGIVSAFHDQGLRPAKVTGSSAGAIVAGGIASGLTPRQMQDLVFSLKREDFWDPGVGLGFLKGRKMRRLLEENFVDSFTKCKIPIEVCVFDLFGWKTRFLNEGSLPQAIVASCAVPFLFHPTRIGSKMFIDGGVFHKSGINANAGERILCVYLERSGQVAAYERKMDLRGLADEHRVLRVDGLPQVRPHTLAMGRPAYDAGYSRLISALDHPFI